MAKSKLRILYGEGDGDVLTTQAAAMEKAGHTVQQAEGRKAVDEALKKSSFDLVVLGPTLTRNDRHHLPYMVKKVTPRPVYSSCTPMAAAIRTWMPAPIPAPAWSRS